LTALGAKRTLFQFCLSKLASGFAKSLTWDRGKELADHKRFTMESGIDVHFCEPQSLWQRGSSENTNRLLRQYFLRPQAFGPERKGWPAR